MKSAIERKENAMLAKASNFRWFICVLLFFATTVNYMDRQVLSLTWKDFIAPEFHWTDTDYGLITAIFSIVYAVANLLQADSSTGWAPRRVICGLYSSGRSAPVCMPHAVGPQSTP